MGCGDLGRFYKGLRELGLKLQENSTRAMEMHTPAQLKDHFMKIGDAESVVADSVLERLPPDREVDEDMAREPNDEEIHEVMATGIIQTLNRCTVCDACFCLHFKGTGMLVDGSIDRLS